MGLRELDLVGSGTRTSKEGYEAMIEQSRGEWTSASNALADRLCPGRHQAQTGLPELVRTDEGDAGTVIHALWTGGRPHREPTAEERDKAQALREQENQVAREFFGTRRGLVRLVERRLWHEFNSTAEDPRKGTLKTSGQPDVILFQARSRRALIFDGKSGWLPVAPNHSNLQLRRLAALLWRCLNPLEVGVCILRPFGRPDAPCVYTLPDLRRSCQEMEEDVRQSHDPNAPRIAGEEQCRYCRARDICSTRLNWLARALPATLPALPMVSARQWSPAQRALFLEREKEARDWLEARKEEIKVLLLEMPDAVPAYALKWGRTIETITEVQEVFNRFCQTPGGSLEAFMKCIKVGKAALKEEVRRLSHHKGLALEREMDALLAGCVEARVAAPTIE